MLDDVIRIMAFRQKPAAKRYFLGSWPRSFRCHKQVGPKADSTCLAYAAEHLRAQGQPLPDALLADTSPPTCEHVGFSGNFLRDSAAAATKNQRTLNLGRSRMAA